MVEWARPRRRRGRPPEPADRSMHTRAALVEAARQLFAREGYGAATLDRIAAEAGFTKGAVYWHFPDKQALFVEVLASGLAHHAVTLEGLFETARTDAAALARELDAFLVAMDEGQDLPLLLLELKLEARHNASLAHALAAVVERHQAALARLVDRYVALTGRQPPVDPALLPATIMTYAAGRALAGSGGSVAARLTVGQLARLLLGMERHAR